MAAKTPVHPAGATIPGGPYTPAIAAGGFLFVSGQVPKKPGSSELVTGDIQVQTRQVLENIRTLLEAAGCTMADVVKVSAHLTDLKNFARFNEVYSEFFTEPYPARTTVQSGLNPGYLVEIDVIAILPDGQQEATR